MLTLFSSHPHPKERFADISAELAYLPRYDWTVDSTDFQHIRKYLASVPAAPQVSLEATRRPAGQGRRTPREWRLAVPGNVDWTDTGIALAQGDRLYIQASGRISWNRRLSDAWTGPEGVPRRGFFKPLSGENTGALIGKIGEESSDYFLVGPRGEFAVPQAGRLFLGINDDNVGDNEGAFDVLVRVTPTR